jgi:hypothetical protein
MEVKSREDRRRETFEEMFARVMHEVFLEESQVGTSFIGTHDAKNSDEPKDQP